MALLKTSSGARSPSSAHSAWMTPRRVLGLALAGSVWPMTSYLKVLQLASLSSHSTQK